MAEAVAAPRVGRDQAHTSPGVELGGRATTESGGLGRVVNECGWDDSVLLLCQFAALMLGMAGRVGFQGMVWSMLRLPAWS